MQHTHYDFIIIGSGAGGGTLARHLAPSGKKILIIERGPWLPREAANWNAREVCVNRKYETTEVWKDKDGNDVHPNAHYNVGGNTKFWGAALFRFRERDFERVVHKGGVSPEWPLKYADFDPYYTKVEELYDVHGRRGEDVTAPPMNQDYPYPPISHEPRVQEIHDALRAAGYHPFHLPTGIRMDEDRKFLSECVRCNTCDGFPCLVQAKADAEMNGVRPALKHSNVTLMTEAKVLRLLTSPSGREIVGVETQCADGLHIFKGDIVVVSCGAINSAGLLLRSANDKHPRGLANGSDQVGRNYMYHLLGAMLAITGKRNPTVFEKTLGMLDFYWGEEDYPYPMGSVQNTGKITADMLAGQMRNPLDGMTFEQMADHSTDWWVMTEDLPDPNNRVTWENDTIKISYTENNRESFDRLTMRWIEILKKMEFADDVVHHSLYIKNKVPVQGVAHQCGTCRFGADPKTSVLDLNCRTHDVDNLYVVDSSFYPSSAALNPTHTLLANALRVGDHLLERVRAGTVTDTARDSRPKRQAVGAY